MALAPASFASYITTLTEFVGPKPEHLSFEEAATIQQVEVLREKEAMLIGAVPARETHTIAHR